MTRPDWVELALGEPGDSAWKRQYRLLQADYRESVLHVEPGLGGRPKRQVASMLPQAAVAERPALNFFEDPWVLALVEDRLRVGGAWPGFVKKDRLLHDLLSSQPLCFNLFGYLRWRPRILAAALSEVLPVSVDEITDVRFEWAPSPLPRDQRYPGCCFDAFIEYTTPGKRGFIAVETKYTESLSDVAKEARRKGYYEISDSSGFAHGSGEALKGRPTFQFWLNALVADRLAMLRPYDEYAIAVLSCDKDPQACNAVDLVNKHRKDGAPRMSWTSYESMIEAIVRVDEGSSAWARKFRQRYLDLSPVLSYLTSVKG